MQEVSGSIPLFSTNEEQDEHRTTIQMVGNVFVLFCEIPNVTLSGGFPQAQLNKAAALPRPSGATEAPLPLPRLPARPPPSSGTVSDPAGGRVRVITAVKKD